ICNPVSRKRSRPPPSVPSGKPASDPAIPEGGRPGGPTAETPPATAPSLSAVEWCARTDTESVGDVVSTEIVEASGLVASRSHPGVFWTHNDGPDTRLFAIGEDGSDLAVFDAGAAGAGTALDIEDIALSYRDGAPELLIADIGDNRLERESIQFIRLPEPDPASPGQIEEVEVVEFVYPDGPHNAETLLVDDDAGLFFIITKDQEEATGAREGLGETLPAMIYEGPLGATAGAGPIELVARGMLDMPALSDEATQSPAHPFALLGAAGVATGGDLAADGSLIALRTYETVWLWDRPAGTSIPDALQGTPCEITAVFEPQGEAVAFAGDRLVTIGEGDNRPINVLAR
ncbi:MAG: hypothetical protein AAFY28_11640, partial [Actinomycetota bacterium]